MNINIKKKIKKKFEFLKKNRIIYSLATNTCKFLENKFNLNENNLVYYKKLNLIYISNPKVASSSINKIIQKKIGIKNIELTQTWKNKTQLEITPKKVINTDCFKFTFVRNPFDRIVSFYCNQVRKDIGTINFRFPFIIEKNMSFKQFVKGISKIPDSIAEQHFRSQYDLIYYKKKPLVQYIGKFETLEKDFEIIRKKFKLEKLPKLNSSNKNRFEEYYDLETAKLVYKRYIKDFKIFGYEKEYQKLLKYIKSKK